MLNKYWVLVFGDTNIYNDVPVVLMFIFYIGTCMLCMYHTYMHVSDSYKMCAPRARGTKWRK